MRLGFHSLSPPVFHDDTSQVDSAVSDGPHGSALDFLQSSSDAPVIFHRGGGKRGGIRLNISPVSELSLLQMNSTPPIGSPRGSMSIRSPSRIHHLSLPSIYTRSSGVDEEGIDSSLVIHRSLSPHRVAHGDSPQIPSIPCCELYEPRPRPFADGSYDILLKSRDRKSSSCFTCDLC